MALALASMFLTSLWRDLHRCFRPAIDAICGHNLSFGIRWRLLALQTLELLAFTLKTTPYIFSKPFTVEWIEIRPKEFFRILVFRPIASCKCSALRPLHISIHGGAFCGGLPEQQIEFCQRVCHDTGAVAISISYRYAPRHVFPAAIDDVDAIIRHLKATAVAKYGADPSLLILSGASAGGNLALAATQQQDCHAPSATAVKAIVAYYPVLELRLSPGQKPKPPGMPASDPLSFLYPLFDSYAAPARAENIDNPRLSPMLADLSTLPDDLLLVIPTLDILLHEELTLVERLRKEVAENKEHAHRRIETLMVEGQFHGWDQLPNFTNEIRRTKEEALTTSMRFLNKVHAKYGFCI